jgi:hypothetical protein
MHVEVIRTIASRRLVIFGSGTFSTFTLYGAHHTSAFIGKSFQYSETAKHAKSAKEGSFPLFLGVLCGLAVYLNLLASIVCPGCNGHFNSHLRD